MGEYKEKIKKHFWMLVCTTISEIDNKDLLPKAWLNYDVPPRSSSKSRVYYRTRAIPDHAPFAASLVTLTLAQTRGYTRTVTSPWTLFDQPYPKIRKGRCPDTA